MRSASWTRDGALLLAALALTACSREPAAEKAATATDSTAKPQKAMAGMDMPGMEMPVDSALVAEVTLSAAQVREGQVRWAPVGTGSGGSVAEVPGQVVSNEDRTARVGAPAGGRVTAVRVQPGSRVATGSVLVTLQSPEASIAQSDLAKARADVSSRKAQAAYAASARQRAERLLALKAIPQQELDRAIADDELARAELAQAEAEFVRARSVAAAIGADGSRVGELAIRSPIAGVVLERMAVPGTVIEPGTPLVTVSDLRTLWLTVDAPERLAGAFRVGGTLRFMVPTFPGDTFSARIDAVAAGLDAQTRTLAVRAVASNAAGKLRPAMLATVAVDGAGAAGAVVVPEDAVQLMDQKPVVFVVQPDGKGGAHFIARAVEIGARSGGRVVVLRGLAPGDVVVTAGAFAVKAQIKKESMPEMEM